MAPLTSDTSTAETSTTSTSGAGAEGAGNSGAPGDSAAAAGAGTGTQPAGDKESVGKDGAAGAGSQAADQGAGEGGGATSAELKLQLPEGFTPDEELLGEFREQAKALGLQSEGAQQLVNLWAKVASAAAAKQEEAVVAQQKAWGEALKADKEFGGSAWDANKAVARKAIVRFGTPELASFLEETGLGDHPELVRLAYRVGKAISEDSVAGAAGGKPTPANSEEQFYRFMYPSSYPDPNAG